MGFGEAVRAFFVNWLDFRGRASRSEFWYAILFCFVLGIAAGILDAAGGTNLFGIALNLALLVPGLSVQVRRLHDGGHSGWWLAATPALVAVAAAAFVAGGEVPGFVALGVCAIAGIGIGLALLIWYCDEGVEGPNEHGPDPRGRSPAVPRHA